MTKVQSALRGFPADLTKEQQKVLRDATDPEEEAAKSVFYKHLIFHPGKATDSFMNIFEFWLKAAHPEHPNDQIRNPRDEITNAYFRAVFDARESLGIDRLSEEISRIVGAVHKTVKQ